MSFLERVYRECKEDLREAKGRVPLVSLQSQIRGENPPRRFERSLRREDRLAVIAEIKFRSPSAGILHDGMKVGEIAAAYCESGADALSVLTETRHFGGELTFIAEAKSKANVPVLRKDFIFDEYQIYESRAAGADAVLLIAAMLQTNQIRELTEAARELKMEVLLELHDEHDLDKAHETENVVLGVNHRSLADLKIDLTTSTRLFPLLPASSTKVAESGIETPGDLRRMTEAGAHAVLMGSSLMRTANPGTALAMLLRP